MSHLDVGQTNRPRKSINRMPLWVIPVVRFGVIAADVILIVVCFISAYKIRESHDILSATAWAWSPEFVPYAGILYFGIVCRLASFFYNRIYRFHGSFSYTGEAVRILKGVLAGSLMLIAWAFLFRGGFTFRDFSYSRGVFVLDFLFALTLILTFHLGLRYVQLGFRRHDINLVPTLIVGSDPEALNTVKILEERPELGYRVIGQVSTDQGMGGDLIDESTFLGHVTDLAKLIRDLEIQEVIITDNEISGERLFDAMMQVGRSQRVEFRFAPRLLDLLPEKTSIEQIGVLPMVRLFRDPLSDVARFTKRLSDLVIAVLAGIITAPLWIITAFIIRADSQGTILFSQERVGMDGRVFLCHKFRTMRPGSDENIHRDAYRKNIDGGSDANVGSSDSPVFGKVKDDPRITKVGGWIRRSSLDEIPQLLNVLKGDMSIVGPRPPIPYEVEDYELWHRKRLDMKPGMTGLWQVSGRNRLTFEEMVRIDLYYIENWSVWLDLKILILTIPAVLRGDGAR